MARQATRLWAQCPPPGALISLAGAVGAAAAVTPDLSADSSGRSFEALCYPPYRPTGGNASRNLFALLKPQRYQSPPAWRWSNPSIASQDPIDAALVPPLKRSRDVRHTLTALPALPQLSLLFRRDPGPCMPLHSHTSSSAKIRRCCADSLNSPPESGHRPTRRACPLSAKSRLMHRSQDCRIHGLGSLSFFSLPDCGEADSILSLRFSGSSVKQIDTWQKTAGCYFTPASPCAWAGCRAARRPRGGVTPPTPRWSARGNSGRRSCRSQRRRIQESLRSPSRWWSRMLDRNERSARCHFRLSASTP